MRAGCLSAFGTSPLSGSLGRVTFLSLSFPLSDPDREVEEFLLVADDDEDDDDEEEVDDEEELVSVTVLYCTSTVSVNLFPRGEDPINFF